MAEDAYLRPADLVQMLDIKPGYHVGDFGVGGAASFAVPLGRAAGTDGEVFMFDVLKTALSGAMSVMQVNGLANGKAVWSNLELFGGAKGVGKNTLDAGVVINVLHQTQRPKDMLGEIHRMLKPGARLLIVDWQPEANLQIAPDRHDRATAEHVASVARSLGFASLKTFEAGPYHWGLILAKT